MYALNSSYILFDDDGLFSIRPQKRSHCSLDISFLPHMGWYQIKYISHRNKSGSIPT